MSTEARFGVSQSSRSKGDTICVVPDLSSDLLEDDFDLNKSYPCTQRPLYKKSIFALQRRYYPGSLTGEGNRFACNFDSRLDDSTQLIREQSLDLHLFLWSRVTI